MSQTPIPPVPQQPQSQSPNRTIMLVLAYLGILALVPLLVEKDDQEIQWHAKHGLVLTATWIILFIALSILSFIVGVIPGLGWVLSILSCGVHFLLWLAILVVHIVAIMKALKGDRLVLPVITEYANKWK